MEIDVRDVLPAIRVPTLVIHRTGDRVIPVESGRYLAEHIPDAKYVELPGVDHFPFVGDIDAIVDEVEEFLTGSRRAREPDRVLATVLFTDIVGSTERAAELGDRRWTEPPRRAPSVVRAELDRHRGKVVRIEGDGTLSTFDGPARAVSCARDSADAWSRSASRSAPACTPARSSSRRRASRASPSTSAPGSPHSRGRARCWPRAR